MSEAGTERPDRGDGTRRVVITGLGVVSSIGIGVDAFTAAVKAGRSGVSPIESFDAGGYEKRNAGEVKDFVPADVLDHLDPEQWGRSGRLAAGAARLAVRDAGIDPALLAASVTGSAVGTASGEPALMYDIGERWAASGGPGMDPAQVRAAPASQLAAAVNTELGLTGEAVTFGTACSASNYAIGYGFDLVRTGEADYFLAGGADSVSRYTHHGFSLWASSPRSAAVRREPHRHRDRPRAASRCCWSRSRPPSPAARGSTPRCSATA